MSRKILPVLVFLAFAAGCGQQPPPRVRPGALDIGIGVPPVRQTMPIEERDRMGPVDVYLDGGEQPSLKGVYLTPPPVSIGGTTFLRFNPEPMPPGPPMPTKPSGWEARQAWHRAIRYVNVSKIVYLKDSEEKKPEGKK